MRCLFLVCFRHSLLSTSFSVLTDLGYAGKVELAFSIFDDMRMAGIPVTVNTYNRLLGVCEKVWSSTHGLMVSWYSAY